MTMSNRKFRTVMSALAGAAVLALAGPACAGIWSSDYDPLPEFVGTASFNVPDACLAAADNLYTVGSLPGCSVITVLTNVSTNPVVIDFAPALPSTDVDSYVVIGGKLVGVNTGIIGGVDVGDINYWFQFVATFTSGGIEFPPTVHNLVNLFSNCEGVPGDVSCGDPIASATQGVTFTRVPEPGSLALILGALGAGWLARRRKIAA
jgi:hypothetical protein